MLVTINGPVLVTLFLLAMIAHFANATQHDNHRDIVLQGHLPEVTLGDFFRAFYKNILIIF